MENKILSVIIPVFNSKPTLQELCTRIDQQFQKLALAYELILVDDGSTDGSFDEIIRIKNQLHFPLIGIKLSKNFGQHNALLCGFNFCKGSRVITMDDDLQHPPEEIPKLIKKMEETNADLVYGLPDSNKQSSVRKAGSTFIKATSEHNQANSRGGSSFRLLKQSLIEPITKNHNNNFLFLDAIFGWYTGNISSVVVEHHKRKIGKSGYTLKKLFFTYLNILVNYSAGPLKVLTYGGLISSLFSFCLGLRFIYKKLVHNVPLGYTSLIVSILFSTGLLLFCMGIIGQYLYKLYQLQNNRPPYSIEKQIQ